MMEQKTGQKLVARPFASLSQSLPSEDRFMDSVWHHLSSLLATWNEQHPSTVPPSTTTVPSLRKRDLSARMHLLDTQHWV